MLLLALLSLLFCLLSFSGYRDPHVLPSFPTRRSSDLSFIVPPILSWYSEPGAIAPGKQVETICDPAYMIRYTDRKSTRLNSSHTVISYAVFCLKKKKSLRDRKHFRPIRRDRVRLDDPR